MDKKALEIRFHELSETLMQEISEDGYWTGRLSSSALGVAVALAALHFHNPEEHKTEISLGLEWLKNHMNDDGSYGDTPESPGNISTSLLVAAALNLFVDSDNSLVRTHERLLIYLQKCDIDVYSDKVADSILAHYKKDFTFSVPILTMCALCGIPEKDAFTKIPQLPFEMALLPRRFYRMLNLTVVSYAIPALIAVGIVIFKNKKSGKITKWIRGKAEKKVLKLLRKSMPDSGGFLEAIPLTAFVSLSLINAGYRNFEVVDQGIAFLKRSQREDGGWPIDIDLSTWVSTLSIKALGKKKNEVLTHLQHERLVNHLKSVQNKSIHSFNGTSPGGWGWTNYSGSVPDGDDTPGAILALLQLAPQKSYTEVLAGGNWLLKLQNRDGGFPTFSKGWGKLPFDQSCSDLTGHCFLALLKLVDLFGNDMEVTQKSKFEKAIQKAAEYLEKNQGKDGAWLPLWFGNQYTQKHENPVYGTARVLTYLNEAALLLSNSRLEEKVEALIARGEGFLQSIQNEDGSWGGAANVRGSIEETALAVSALQKNKFKEMRCNALNWLDLTFKQEGLKAAPIGLYFASLWYNELMYPLTAYLEAVERELRME